MAPVQALKSTKESLLKAEDPIIEDDDVKVSASGRPIRKGAGKRSSDSNYVNSIEAIRDTIGDLIEEKKQIYSNSKTMKKKVSMALKRPRSPTPPPLHPVECPDQKTFTAQESSPDPEITEATAFEPINLTFNIPIGFHGPLKVQLTGDLIAQLSTPSPLVHNFPSQRPIKRQRLSEEPTIKPKKSSKPSKIERWVKKYGQEPRGFCHLPPEIRNIIYRMVFVSNNPIDFGNPPSNCKHSAAFLRTCQMVHVEGCSILYQENRFVFRRNKNARNPFWSNDNKEIGYLDMRHFLNMIGYIGRINIRKIHIVFDDATRPQAMELPNCDGRYTNDGNLLASLKLIARECSLEKLGLAFFGRRHLTTYDVRFLEHICAIEADEVVINPFNEWAGDKIEYRCKDVLYSEMIRRDPIYYSERSNRDRKERRSFW